MGPVWLFVSAVVVGVARGADTQCWDRLSCEALDSDNSLMVMPSTLALPSASASATEITSFLNDRSVMTTAVSCSYLLASPPGLLLRSSSTAATLTSLPRPPSSLGMPTSNSNLNQRPSPSASLHPPSRPRPNAPTPWSTSAGGSPSAENAAQSRCTPPTALRKTPRRRSLRR